MPPAMAPAETVREGAEVKGAADEEIDGGYVDNEMEKDVDGIGH